VPTQKLAVQGARGRFYLVSKELAAVSVGAPGFAYESMTPSVHLVPSLPDALLARCESQMTLLFPF
jgi:hypothetical protein